MNVHAYVYSVYMYIIAIVLITIFLIFNIRAGKIAKRINVCKYKILI